MSNNVLSDNPPLAYVLRVNIAGIKPPVWRKLNVPGGCTLGDLHYILQIAFGWDNSHLHSFTVESTRYGSIDDEEDFGFDDMIDEDTVRLDDLSLRPKQKFTYLYDFGDSWEHGITVSKIISIDAENEESARIRCLEGERAGPPDDSGGIWGYMDMLEVLKDPNHERYEEIHEWIGDFDPEDFSLEETNARLEEFFKPLPKKPKKK
jgi:hypothetical protein